MGPVNAPPTVAALVENRTAILATVDRVKQWSKDAQEAGDTTALLALQPAQNGLYYLHVAAEWAAKPAAVLPAGKLFLDGLLDKAFEWLAVDAQQHGIGI